jgi:CRISPR/Cas system endoribonuclease Cas6 (RAMP superfamily)
MPVRLLIPIEVARPADVSPLHVHALVCRWLEGPRSRAAHHANTKPFAVSPLREVGEDSAGFEVGLLDDCLEERLLDAADRAARGLELGDQHGHTAGAPSTMRRASWADLDSDQRGPDRFRLDFLTATAFRSGGINVPLPMPSQVFGHYRARWAAYAPPGLEVALAFDGLGLLITGLELRSAWQPMPGGAQIGFVGSATLAAKHADIDARRALHRLALLAEFAGTGAGTALGMGVTRYTPEWRDPASR